MIDREKDDSRNGEQLDLSDIFHEVKALKHEGPGVYYVGAHDGSDALLCDEYYVVEVSSPIISAEAKKYGREIPGHPSLLLYPFSEERSGYKIIEYEVARNAVKSGSGDCSPDDLHITAYYNMEFHPEYFGKYPAPSLTPCGYTTRYRTLDNGIFLLETDRGDSLLAVCYPVWECEFSTFLKQHSLRTEHDLKHGIDNTLGYSFFEEAYHCLVIFELLAMRDEWIEKGIVLQPQLMNAIWKHHPDYAAVHNIEEQHGLHDGLGMLLNALGETIELTSSPDRMISITPDAGCDYLRL